LIKSIKGLEVDERESGKGNVKHIYIRRQPQLAENRMQKTKPKKNTQK